VGTDEEWVESVMGETLGRWERRESGAVAVEFALLLPVLLLVLIGTIQFGIVYSQYQVMEGAAREGARCAAVQAAGFTDCNPVARVDAALPAGYTRTGDISILVDDPDSPYACSEDTVGANVTVSWEQEFSLGLLGNLVPGLPDTVTRTVRGTFRCE
jgi:Flp pilus assembly protein TadG